MMIRHIGLVRGLLFLDHPVYM